MSTNIGILAKRYNIPEENCFNEYLEHNGKRYIHPNSLRHKGSYILFKSRTGFGGTTSALELDELTIIITPNKTQVRDKESNYPSRKNNVGRAVAFIYSGSRDRWKDAIDKKAIIYCTYDQLAIQTWRKGAITNLGKYIIGQYTIIVDEYHMLPLIGYRTRLSERLIKFLKVAMSPSGDHAKHDAKATSRVIFTSASYFDLSKVGIKVPTYLYHDGYEKRRLDWNRKSSSHKIIQRAQEGLRDYKHIVIFTNKASIIKSFKNPDIIVGSQLASKVMLYTDANSSCTELDTSKRIHIISSAGWLGFDIYETDVLVLFYAEYGMNMHHLFATEEDVFQAMGRFRNGYKRAELHTRKHPSFKNIEWSNSEDIYNEVASEVIEKGVKQILSYYKSSVRFNYHIKEEMESCMARSIELNMVNAYDNTDNVVDILKHISFKKVNANRSKRTSIHSGLSPQEALFVLGVNIVGKSDRLRGIIKRYEEDSNHISRGFNTFFKDLYDILTTHLQATEVGMEFKLSDATLDMARIEQLIQRDSSLTARLRMLNELVNERFIGVFCGKSTGDSGNLEGIDYQGVERDFGVNVVNSIENSSFPPIDKIDALQSSDYKNVKSPEVFYDIFQKIGTPIIRDSVIYIYLYNSLLLDNSAIEQEVKAIYESDIEHQEKGYKTFKRIVSNMIFDALLERFGYHNEISIEKDGREYNHFVSAKKVLRRLLPENLIEVDATALFPTLVGCYFKSLGSTNYSEKVAKNPYKVDGLTRDEAKTKVNSFLNLHSISERTHIPLLESIGMSRLEASHFYGIFGGTKGLFFRTFAPVEKAMIEALRSSIGVDGIRLHDALYIPSEYEKNIPHKLKFNHDGIEYEVFLKSNRLPLKKAI